MDPRLEFAFQLLMDATQLSRHEVMDHVFEGDMLDEINQLFLPHMKSTLVWYYQEAEESETLRPTEMVKSLFSKEREKAFALLYFMFISDPEIHCGIIFFADANENLDLQARPEHVGAKSEGTEGSEGTRQKEVVSHRWMASSLHWNMHLYVQV